MEKYIDITNCTSCEACVNSCKFDAIKLILNDAGKRIPEIDKSKCINCNLCRKSCPVINSQKTYKPKKGLAVWTKNDIDKYSCASGGVATGLTRYYFENNFSVFSCIYSNNHNFEIKEIQTITDIEKAKGSKYSESYVGDSYIHIREKLITGKEVLFIGLPCQVSGLKQYLGKDYNNLLTIDLICHGTPSAQSFKNYIDYLKINKNDIDDISFRKQGFKLIITGKHDNILYSKSSEIDLYYRAFMEGITYRDCCYKCKYAKPERISDITIGDYWGFNYDKYKISLDTKISCVLLNTDKGEKVFDSIALNFNCINVDIENIINGNNQLQKPTIKTKECDLYMKYYNNNDFAYAVKKTNIVFKIMKTKMIWLTPRFIKKILRS